MTAYRVTTCFNKIVSLTIATVMSKCRNLSEFVGICRNLSEFVGICRNFCPLHLDRGNKKLE